MDDAAILEIPAVVDLDTAQRIALRENPSLRAAEERVNQAKHRVRQAQAEWFPLVGASVTASVSETPGVIIDEQERAIRQGQLSRVGGLVDASMGDLTTIGVGLVSIGADLRDALNDIDDTNESYQASLSATWLIFDGFGRKFRNAAARYASQETEASYFEAQRLILSVIATAYYNVQLARENIAIAEADQAFNERQLRESEARRRVGTGALSDVLNFEIRVRAALSNAILAERNYRIALIALAELMGIDQADLAPAFEVAPLYDELPQEMEPPAPDGLIVYALGHRPDLSRAESTLDRAGAIVKVQRSQYFPRVSAFASEDAFRSQNIEFDGDDFGGTIGVGVNYDIYAGGRRKAQLKEAKAFEREVDYLVREIELQVASEVRQAVENLTTAQEELVIQRETTQYVERNLDLVEKEYREGQGSLVRLNEAQRDLIAQQSRLALSLVALRLNWHDVRTATAQSLEEHRQTILEASDIELDPAAVPEID
jgi:outer membrane protein TolC